MYSYEINNCNYGISQNPNTKVYILVFGDNNLYYYCKKCGNKDKNCDGKWCKLCQINQLKNDFTNWTSGNEKIDDFIQKKQLEFKNNKVLFEWIPFNKIINVEELGDNCLTTAVWKDGPLYYNKIECRKELYKKVCLKYLHNSQDNNDEFLTEVLECSINLDWIILK
jgi:hypothetical protein